MRVFKNQRENGWCERSEWALWMALSICALMYARWYRSPNENAMTIEIGMEELSTLVVLVALKSARKVFYPPHPPALPISAYFSCHSLHHSYFNLRLPFPFTLSIAWFNVQPQKKMREKNSRVFFSLSSVFVFPFSTSRLCAMSQCGVCSVERRELHVLNRQIFRRWSGWSDGNTTTTNEQRMKERKKNECKEADKLFLSSLFSQIV